MSENYLRVRGEYGKSLGISLICLELPPRARRIHASNPRPGSR